MTLPPLDEYNEMFVLHTDPADGPQPMEVARSDTASIVDAQTVEDPLSTRFALTIENFSGLNIRKLYSDVFHIGGCKWRVLDFLKGNNVDPSLV